jgi:hypothetical protein
MATEAFISESKRPFDNDCREKVKSKLAHNGKWKNEKLRIYSHSHSGFGCHFHGYQLRTIDCKPILDGFIYRNHSSPAYQMVSKEKSSSMVGCTYCDPWTFNYLPGLF